MEEGWRRGTPQEVTTPEGATRSLLVSFSLSFLLLFFFFSSFLSSFELRKSLKRGGTEADELMDQERESQGMAGLGGGREGEEENGKKRERKRERESPISIPPVYCLLDEAASFNAPSRWMNEMMDGMMDTCVIPSQRKYFFRFLGILKKERIGRRKKPLSRYLVRGLSSPGTPSIHPSILSQRLG